MGFSSNDPRNYLAFAKQTAADTEASTGFKFLRYIGDGGFNVDLQTQSIYTGGDGQDQGLHYLQEVSPDGSFDTFAWPDQFTYLSAWALGSGVTPPSVADTNVASHIYTPNATVPFLTAEQAWGGGNQIDRVSNAIFTGFTIEAEHGQPWKMTVPFITGGTPYWRDGAASALSATLESGNPAMYAGGAYVINGATEIDLLNWTYTFSRQVDDNLRTVSPFRRKIVPLTRSVELSGQIIHQNASYYQRVVYGGPGGTVVPFTLATGSFHGERVLTSSQLIAIDIPNLNFTGLSVNRLDPDGQTVILDFTAMGVKSGTGVVQHRANITGRATSYLV